MVVVGQVSITRIFSFQEIKVAVFKFDAISCKAWIISCFLFSWSHLVLDFIAF